MGKMCIVWITLILLITGCEKQGNDKQPREFTICTEEQIPEEIRKVIEEKKEIPFQFTYSLQEYMYIIIGYGLQIGSGYSIEVIEFSEDEKNLYVDTNLLHEKVGKNVKSDVYPYIVLKCIRTEKSVIFLAYK